MRLPVPAGAAVYHALRERDQLAAEYAALEERNGALESDVSSLQTDAGIEDRAHEQFGWVKKGEETANVRGLDLDEDEASRSAPASRRAASRRRSVVLAVPGRPVRRRVDRGKGSP
ncbi:MAG: FtsB family cell division protein [Eggerthellaceae bacterium]